MPWSPDVPFNDLPPLPPDGLELEPKPVLKATIEARTALATLAQAGQLLPNPNVLIHAVPLLEAQASSEIENIMTTADELFKYADSGGGDHATKEALRYRSALFAGVQSIRKRPLTAQTAARVCSELQGREMAVRAVPGTRIANPTTRKVVYAPPEGADLIREKLAAWERFVHAEDDIDPLVRMAVAHYQFEAIHPFHDGNGRTGRVVNILMLIEAELLRDPSSISRARSSRERTITTGSCELSPLRAPGLTGSSTCSTSSVNPRCRRPERSDPSAPVRTTLPNGPASDTRRTRRAVPGRALRAAVLPHRHGGGALRRLATDRILMATRARRSGPGPRRQGRQRVALRQPRVSRRPDTP